MNNFKIGDLVRTEDQEPAVVDWYCQSMEGYLYIKYLDRIFDKYRWIHHSLVELVFSKDEISAKDVLAFERILRKLE